MIKKVCLFGKRFSCLTRRRCRPKYKMRESNDFVTVNWKFWGSCTLRVCMVDISSPGRSADKKVIAEACLGGEIILIHLKMLS